MVRRLRANMGTRHDDRDPPGTSRIGTGKAAFAVVLSLTQLLHLGCAPDSERDRPSSTPVTTIGRTLDAPRNQIFAEVVDGRITPDGQHLVILDAAPPYLRVFDRTGAIVTAAVGGGKGPLEMTDPHSLAVTNGSVAIVDLGTIKEFSLDGSLNRVSSNLDFLPQTISRGCNGEWVVYGPGREADGTISWLRAIDLSEEPPAERVLLVDRNRGSGVVVRRSRPVTASNGRLLLYHDATNPPTTILYQCPGYTELGRYSSGEESSEEPAISHASEFEAVRPSPDAAPLSSVFFLSDTPLITVMRWENGRGSFEIRSPQADRIGTVTPASRVLDVQGDFVLLALDDPVPHVVLTEATAVLAASDGDD